MDRKSPWVNVNNPNQIKQINIKTDTIQWNRNAEMHSELTDRVDLLRM